MLEFYAPARVWKAFRFILTVFLLVRQKKRLLFFRPLAPEALKRVILDLGVSFIKLSQVLATRADFFSGEYLKELGTILDEVAPMPPEDLEVMYRRAFGDAPPFARFEKTPIASASIGQVHCAQLADGTPVAVKIRRLNIDRNISADIRILRCFLRLFQPFFSRYTKHSLEAVVAEFSRMIVREADMAVELDNLRKFREIYRDSGIRMPGYHFALSGRDALVMSFEEGVRIDDREELERLNIPFKKVMNSLITFYVEQMLVRGYFHADPHPGNLLVRGDGSLVLLDYGMVKRLPDSARKAMIEMVRAANEQDFEAYIAACKRLGVVTPTAPESQMQEFSERMFDIFSNEHLSAANMQALAFDVLDSMKELPFKLPQEVVYVMRASSLIEGLGTRYIENFNGVKDILPVLRENLQAAMVGREGFVSYAAGELCSLPLTLRKVRSIIDDMSGQNLQIKLSRETVELLGELLRTYIRPVGVGLLLIAAAFFILQLGFEYREEAAASLLVLGMLRIFTAL